MGIIPKRDDDGRIYLEYLVRVFPEGRFKSERGDVVDLEKAHMTMVAEFIDWFNEMLDEKELSLHFKLLNQAVKLKGAGNE